MPDLAFHEAADIFPLLEDDGLDALADDIKKNGLQIPIETHEGKILDGRNRYRACLLRGVEPDIIEAETDDPIDYVLTMNLHRRHLSTTQLGLVGAKANKLREKFAAAAKERKKRKPGSVKENSSSQTGAQTRDQLGEAVGVSGNTIDKGRRVLASAIPAVVKAAETDAISINKADKIARLPNSEQKAALKEALLPAKSNSKPKRQRNRPGQALVETIKGDLDSLIRFVQGADKGLKVQRERTVTNLRLAKKYVSAATDFFT